MSDLNKERERAKMLLLEKLKNLKISSENAPSNISNNIPSTPIQIPRAESLKQVRQNKAAELNKMKDVVKKSAQQQEIMNQNEQKKEDHDEQEKMQNINKDPKKSVRTKRPYYEHYVKQGVFQPMLQYVRNHPNPSGKPPNIPPEMYQGIQVVPKRPWVFFGPENIPPSDCQQINEKTFSAIFEKAKKSKGTGVFKKSNKKKGKRGEDQISEVSDQFTSNFTFSDSVDLSKQSDLISEFRTQTKTMKMYDSGNIEESEVEDDFSSVSGSVTQRHRYNLFDSSSSEEEKESQNVSVSKRKKKFKRLIQSSDEQPSKSSANKGSSFQASSAIINAGSSGNQPSGQAPVVSSKGSSNRVEVDDAQSSFSKSKSRSQMKVEPVAPKRETRRRKKRQLDSDQD